MNSLPAAFSGCTTIIHHPAAAATGLREVGDESAAVAVRAFAFADVAAAVAAGGLACAGAYLLCGQFAVYIGESGNVSRRLVEHAADDTKRFATEVFAIIGAGAPRLDKPSILYLQARLTAAAEAAHHVGVQKGVSPCIPDLPAYRVATLERMLADAFRLLYDAGCRVFHRCRPIGAPDPAAVLTDEPDDPGLMEIGVADVPPGVPQYELIYTDTWARGYQHEDRFVVLAGSEIRNAINPSTNPILRERRERLEAANVLMPIAGIEDRVRLRVAVAFPSAAIAAKVVCGAHVNAKTWRPLAPANPAA
jgi:hypothetical protein